MRRLKQLCLLVLGMLTVLAVVIGWRTRQFKAGFGTYPGGPLDPASQWQDDQYYDRLATALSFETIADEQGTAADDP